MPVTHILVPMIDVRKIVRATRRGSIGVAERHLIPMFKSVKMALGRLRIASSKIVWSVKSVRAVSASAPRDRFVTTGLVGIHAVKKENVPVRRHLTHGPLEMMITEDWLWNVRTVFSFRSPNAIA